MLLRSELKKKLEEVFNKEQAEVLMEVHDYLGRVIEEERKRRAKTSQKSRKETTKK